MPNALIQMIGFENDDYDALHNPPIDSCLYLKDGGDAFLDCADSMGRITLYLALWSGALARS